MGYRACLYVIKKTELVNIKKYTKNMIIKLSEDGDALPYFSDILDVHNAKPFFELGEPTWGCEFNKYLSLLLSKELDLEYNHDRKLKRLSKSGLLFLINHVKFKVIEGIESDLLTLDLLVNSKSCPDLDLKKERLIRLMNYKLREWKENPPNNLEKDTVTDSWMYEYIIFEMSRLYKIMDWEESSLIYYEG